jgi:hypothetical protein
VFRGEVWIRLVRSGRCEEIATPECAVGIPHKRLPRYQRDPAHELALLHVADERGRVWLKNLQRFLLAIFMVIAAVAMVMTLLNGHLPTSQELHDLLQLLRTLPAFQ